MSAAQHSRLRLLIAVSSCVLGLFLCIAIAQAQELPGGVTCAQVVYYASEFNIPNTTMGRVRAKIIALALGMRLTNAQLDAAARCIRESKR